MTHFGDQGSLLDHSYMLFLSHPFRILNKPPNHTVQPVNIQNVYDYRYHTSNSTWQQRIFKYAISVQSPVPRYDDNSADKKGHYHHCEISKVYASFIHFISPQPQSDDKEWGGELGEQP